jgi:hypothetical protein
MGVQCWIFVLLASYAAAFYLPGVAPRAYQKVVYNVALSLSAIICLLTFL